MEFVKKYKSLLIASAVGLILSIAVASDESSGLNVFQAFVSAEVFILIVYFTFPVRKRRLLPPLKPESCSGCCR